MVGTPQRFRPPWVRWSSDNSRKRGEAASFAARCRASRSKFQISRGFPFRYVCQSVISSFRQDVFASTGESDSHHESAFDLALRFACGIFRKSAGAFWPKHNLIPTRSNHTRETSHFITSVLNTSPAKELHRSSFLSPPRTVNSHRHTCAACSHITRRSRLLNRHECSAGDQCCRGRPAPCGVPTCRFD